MSEIRRDVVMAVHRQERLVVEDRSVVRSTTRVRGEYE